MHLKRETPRADSIAANLQAARHRDQLVATGAIKPGEKASKWYNHLHYRAVFAALDIVNFRKRMRKLLVEKYEEAATKSML